MKKLIKLICLAAILYVAYLALTTPRGEAEPALKPLEAKVGEYTAQPNEKDEDSALPNGGNADDAQKNAVDVETGNHERTKTDDTETDDIAGQMKTLGQDAVGRADEVIGDAVTRADEAIEDVVKQADEVIEGAVEQADQALTDAMESAAEGAKEGFVESLKKSASEFWEKLLP